MAWAFSTMAAGFTSSLAASLGHHGRVCCLPWHEHSLPDDLDDVSLRHREPGMSAWMTLSERGALVKGETVLIQAQPVSPASLPFK